MKNQFIYSDDNKRYHTLTYFYKQKFHSKVCKVSLNAGFTCPNIDGKVGYGGCIYCSKLGSGEFGGNPLDPLEVQFEKGKKMMQRKWPNAKFIAYFQAHSNTYAPIDKLKKTFEPFINKDDVVGIAIATRSDCLTDECIEYLDTINKRTFLIVELGLQTIHAKTAQLLNRCSSLNSFEQAIKKLRAKNIHVIVHIINSLPYETEKMMIETAQYVNKLDIQGIKIHMLNILKDTKLEQLYNKHPFPILTKEEYVKIVVKQLEYLRPEIIIHRLTGEFGEDELIAPKWVLKKVTVLNEIDKYMSRNDIYQGDLCKEDENEKSKN